MSCIFSQTFVDKFGVGQLGQPLDGFEGDAFDEFHSIMSGDYKLMKLYELIDFPKYRVFCCSVGDSIIFRFNVCRQK